MNENHSGQFDADDVFHGMKVVVNEHLPRDAIFMVNPSILLETAILKPLDPAPVNATPAASLPELHALADRLFDKMSQRQAMVLTDMALPVTPVAPPVTRPVPKLIGRPINFTIGVR